jgi:hypothetical protein
MHGKDHCRQKSPGNRQFPQDKPNQQSVDYVNNQIDGTVTGRIHPPHAPLDPKHGIGHRIVFRRFSGKPELVRTVRGLDKVIIRQKKIVIQDESAPQRMEVSKKDKNDD